MSLENQINTKLKDAMKSKDKVALRSLRAIKAEILKDKTKEGGTGEVSEDNALKILTKMAKQRRDSLEIFKGQGREDLAVIEQEELTVLEQFLPKQMTEAEVTESLKGIIEKLNPGGPQDMGKVMGVAMKELSGKADGKIISSIVRNLLNN